jgi:hypothetical protein
VVSTSTVVRVLVLISIAFLCVVPLYFATPIGRRLPLATACYAIPLASSVS